MDGCTTVTPTGLARACSWCGDMTEAEAVAEAARLTAATKGNKGVKFTAQKLCRGWAVERRVATQYFAFDGYIHEASNADHHEQGGG